MKRVKTDLGRTVFNRIIEGLHSNRITSFRKNGLISSEADPLAELATSGLALKRHDLIPDAAWVEPQDRDMLLFSSAHEGKRIYVQNLASMLPVHALEPAPGERILDLTAAPGSKTLQIAERAGTTAEIAAVEVVRKRFFRMKANLAENGAFFVRTFLKDGCTVWRNRPEYFDKVLLDAPCASEGRFNARDPHSTRFWSEKKGREMARKQKKLLHSAIRSARVGGSIVYSTCSLSVVENEKIISDALNRFGGALESVPIELDVPERIPPIISRNGRPLNRGVTNAVRLIPSARMEGFFFCRLRKLTRTDH